MNRGGGAAGAAAQGIMGYLKGMQMTKDMETADEDRKAREEDRAYVRQQRADQQDEQRQMKAAAAPVEVVQGANGMTKPETADNRDVGAVGDVGVAQGGLTPGVRVAGKAYTDPAAATQAVADANTPEAIAGRQVAALRGLGKATEAAQLEAATTQNKTAKFTLSREEQKFADEKFDKALSSVTDANHLAEILSQGGTKYDTVASADGKKVQLVTTGADGQQVKFGPEIDNTPKGLQAAIVAHSKSMTPAQKVTFMQAADQHAEQKRQFEVTKKQQDDHFKVTSGIQQQQVGISRDHLKLAQDEAGVKKQERESNIINKLPPVTKLRVEGLQRSIQGVEKALNDADARGDGDPKGISNLRVRLTQHQEELDKILSEHAGAKPGEKAPGPMPRNDYMGYRPGANAATVAGSAAPAPAGSVAPVAARGGSIVSAAQAAQPARAPVPTAANASVDPVLVALGGASGMPAVDASRQAQLAPLRAAAGEFQQAGAQLAAAANSGDQAAIAQYTQALEAQRAKLGALLEGMPQENRDRIMQALGV